MGPQTIVHQGLLCFALKCHFFLVDCISKLSKCFRAEMKWSPNKPCPVCVRMDFEATRLQITENLTFSNIVEGCARSPTATGLLLTGKGVCGHVGGGIQEGTLEEELRLF